MKRALAAALCFAFAASAQAEPGGVSGVSGPGVDDGDIRFELRTAAYQGDALDGAWAHRAQAGYGVTDWWQTTLNLRASQPDGASAELTSIGLENRIEFQATRAWPVHLGAQAEYKFGLHGAEDELELKLLAERAAGDFNVRLNLIAARELGDGAEWESAYAARLGWRASDALSLGLEAYGEFDAAAHAAGPRAAFRLGQATLAVSYLLGFDEARADSQVRVGLEFAP